MRFACLPKSLIIHSLLSSLSLRLPLILVRGLVVLVFSFCASTIVDLGRLFSFYKTLSFLEEICYSSGHVRKNRYIRA